MLTGFSRTSLPGGVPLPLDLGSIGMTGCRLYVSNEIVESVPRSGSSIYGSVRIPNDPALLDARFFQQVVLPDPGANSVGLVMSNACEAVIRGQ